MIVVIVDLKTSLVHKFAFTDRARIASVASLRISGKAASGLPADHSQIARTTSLWINGAQVVWQACGLLL